MHTHTVAKTHESSIAECVTLLKPVFKVRSKNKQRNIAISQYNNVPALGAGIPVIFSSTIILSVLCCNFSYREFIGPLIGGVMVTFLQFQDSCIVSFMLILTMRCMTSTCEPFLLCRSSENCYLQR